ncbi:MAG: hypothetical protein ACOYCD_03075 [Kiritimatiellia bacterium]|jgi:hypothetical protein
MAKEIMTRKASDNVYFHRDFHCALNAALEYIRVNFGDAAVREYLEQFAAAYHAPLQADLRRRGLAALREYFENMYRLEGGLVRISGDDEELLIEVERCPAVEHIRRQGGVPSALYAETTRVVNETICRDTPYAFELRDYNPLTGAGLQRFYRRQSCYATPLKG